MSVQVMAWVFEQDHRELRPSETLVLLSLANHASSDGGYAYPSVGTMAGETNLVRRSVQQALRSLVERGIISEQRAATSKLGAMYQFESFRTGRNLEHPDTDHVGAHKMRRGGANPAPKPSGEPSGVLETPNVVSNTSVRESRISLFAAFWESYPRAGRNSKSRTADAFSRLRGDELPLVMSGLGRWLASERWQRGIVVDAAKWLKERRWEVDPGAAVTASGNGATPESKGPVVEKVISRWATAAQELTGQQQQSSENVVEATWR